jgi:LiaI-LiaF-like transmembrane region
MSRFSDRRSSGRLDLGAILFAAVLIFVGGYYLLRNTFGFDLADLDGDAIWPIAVIALGIVVLYNTWGRQADKSVQ